MTGNWGGPRIGKRCSKATWECAVVLATPKDPTQSGCGVLLWFCTVAIRNGNLKVIVQIGVRSLPRSANTLFAHVCIVASDLVIKLIIQHSMNANFTFHPSNLYYTISAAAESAVDAEHLFPLLSTHLLILDQSYWEGFKRDSVSAGSSMGNFQMPCWHQSGLHPTAW